MDNTRSSIIGAFVNIRDAQRAVSELHAAGIPATDIRLIANDQDEGLDNNRTDSTWSQSYPERKGGVMNFFSRLFGMDDERKDVASYHDDSQKYFADHYQQRRHLVLVYTGENRQEAVRVLESCGGIVEDKASMLYEQEIKRSRGQSPDLSSEQVMQLNQEELVAQKQTVQTGEVQLRKEVVTETKTIEVPVSREEVVIERRALDQSEVASTQGRIDMAADETREIRIPVSEEQVTIEKKVVPREEILVSKQRVEGVEQVTEDLRRERVDIEKEGEVTMRGERLEEDEEQIAFDKPRTDKDRRRDREASDSRNDRPAGPRPRL